MSLSFFLSFFRFFFLYLFIYVFVSFDLIQEYVLILTIEYYKYVDPNHINIFWCQYFFVDLDLG